MSRINHIIPDAKYLVTARDHHGACQNAYCDTMEEAEEAAALFGEGYEFVEILKAIGPGKWESVSQSW